MAAIARWTAERLNAGSGSRAVMIPLRGYSMLNREGQVLYDDASNKAYVKSMVQALSTEVELIELDAHINDRAFADAVVDTFLRLRAADL